MSHTIREKEKLLRRIHRVLGQVEALERAVERERPCGDVLQLIAAARGAMNGLMAEVLADHIRYHIGSDPKHRAEVEELVEVTRRYLR